MLSGSDLLGGAPGAVALTVFAGAPPSWTPATPWDRACGFGDGDDVIAARREEDRRALERLAATPGWLDVPEVEYRNAEPEVGALADTIAEAVTRLEPEEVAVPVGLHHEDHLLAHRAAVAAARRTGHDRVILYADYYHRDHPAELEARMAELGPDLPVHPVPRIARRRKRSALRSYRSQAQGLGRSMPRWASEDRERYWRLALRPR